MNSIRILCRDISKTFSGKSVFKNVNFELSDFQSLCITGRNGSGKSTLIKIISGLIHPSKGKIVYEVEGNELPKESWFEKTGLISPYINLYEELSGYENLDFFYRLRSSDNGKDKINGLLEAVGLKGKGNELLKNYSSGMKQRLKLAFSVLHDPDILVMDEPRMNLDSAGIEIMNEIALRQKKRGMLIIATNDEEDQRLCEKFLNIQDFVN